VNKELEKVWISSHGLIHGSILISILRDWENPLTYHNGDCQWQRYELSHPEYKTEILLLVLTCLVDKREGLTVHETYIYDKNQKS
jgi:hypothetical protein